MSEDVDIDGQLLERRIHAAKAALEELNEAAEELQRSMLESVREGLAGAGAAGEETNSREDALPEPIREARKRREKQREAERGATDWYDHD